MDHSGGPVARISPLQTLVLDLPPSCVEFCPAHPDYFIIGTYNLEAAENAADKEAEVPASGNVQARTGSLVLFRLQDGSLIHVHTVVESSAVLDLHFQHIGDRRDICAVVTSTAFLELFRLRPSSHARVDPLQLLASHRIPDVQDDVLFLSCSWHPSNAEVVAITTSAGKVYVLNLSGDYMSVVQGQDPVLTHTLEVWCVALSPWPSAIADSSPETFTLYSGADDSTMQCLSCAVVNSSCEDQAGAPAVYIHYPAVKIPGHTAGVTAILPLPINLSDGLSVVLTGSYDEFLRVYAIQPPETTMGARKFRLLAERCLGGGVWRLKLVDVEERSSRTQSWRVRVLASCMHAGAMIVEVRGQADDRDGHYQVQILGLFDEHKSMNYGSDSRPGPEVGNLICVSTSFYDKLVCLWSFKLD